MFFEKPEFLIFLNTGVVSSDEKCIGFSFFDGTEHIDYTAGKCRYDYLLKKSWCFTDISWDWCNPDCPHDNGK